MPSTRSEHPGPTTHPGSRVSLLGAEAEVFVPDGLEAGPALARCTDFAIGAHPDDLEVLALTAIERCFESGEEWFAGAVVTDGVGGPSRAAGLEDLGRRRREEQRAAALVGRYAAVAQLGATSAAIKAAEDPTAVGDLSTLLDLARPRTLWLHNPADRHETHVAVLLRSLEAVRSLPVASRPRAAFGVEVWRDLDWLSGEDRVELPVGRHPHLTRALIGCYGSQIDTGKRYDLAVEARSIAHATFADSHAADRAPGIALAIDLTPCLADDGPTALERVEAAMDRLRVDVRTRLERVGARG